MSLTDEHASPLFAVRLRWTLLGVGGLLAMGWSYGRFVALPMIAARGESLERLAALDRLMEADHQTRQSSDAVQAEAERLDALSAAYRGRVPRQADESDFLKWVSGLADECGLTISDFRPVSRTAQAPYEIQTVRIASHGSYAGVARLLDGLRDCPRLNRIAGWELIPLESNRSNYSLTLQIQLFSAPNADLAPTSSKGA